MILNEAIDSCIQLYGIEYSYDYLLSISKYKLLEILKINPNCNEKDLKNFLTKACTKKTSINLQKGAVDSETTNYQREGMAVAVGFFNAWDDRGVHLGNIYYNEKLIPNRNFKSDIFLEEIDQAIDIDGSPHLGQEATDEEKNILLLNEKKKSVRFRSMVCKDIAYSKNFFTGNDKFFIKDKKVMIEHLRSSFHLGFLEPNYILKNYVEESKDIFTEKETETLWDRITDFNNIYNNVEFLCKLLNIKFEN